jgi:hypothetical protein
VGGWVGAAAAAPAATALLRLSLASWAMGPTRLRDAVQQRACRAHTQLSNHTPCRTPHPGRTLPPPHPLLTTRMKKLYDGMNDTHGKVRRELFALQKEHTRALGETSRLAQQLAKLQAEAHPAAGK